MKLHVSKIIWMGRSLIYKPLLKRIGIPSYIGKPVFIEGGNRIAIGKRVRIFPGIRMEAHKEGFITIKDNVYIGQNCHITSADYNLVIGKGSSVMANVCITNIDHNYENIELPVLEQGFTTRNTVIGENCFIGHGAIIQAGVVLGSHVVVGANAVVCRGEYPDNCVVVGCPAVIVKKYNETMKEWKGIDKGVCDG